MNINATFIIQAIHFFIAYLLLRFLLFKPAVKIIQKKEYDKGVIRKSIVNMHELIKDKENERKKHWLQCREFYLNKDPKVVKKELFIFDTLGVGSRYMNSSEENVEDLVLRATNELVKKVGNDYQ